MQKLTYEGQTNPALQSLYDKIAHDFEEQQGFQGVDVDVSPVAGNVELTIAGQTLVMKPVQAADLMKNLRRAIVKTDPSALRS